MADTLFKSTADIPPQDETLDPSDMAVSTRQSTKSRAGALWRYQTGPENMNVVNCCRPRRGHDY
jgi:hypothetical protein